MKQALIDWFKTNQKALRKQFGSDSYLVIGMAGVLYSARTGERCQEWVIENNLPRAQTLITHTNTNAKSVFLRHERERRKVRLHSYAISEKHKQIFAWFDKHYDDITERYNQDTYLVCDLTGVLYAHKELCFCWQWVLEKTTKDNVIVRQVRSESEISYGLLPNGLIGTGGWISS